MEPLEETPVHGHKRRHFSKTSLAKPQRPAATSGSGNGGAMDPKGAEAMGSRWEKPAYAPGRAAEN